MAEHLRALVVVMACALGYFYVARAAVTQILPESTYRRWRNLWVVATLILFLSYGMWAYMLVLGAVLLVAGRREEHVVGLYFLLLFVSPPAPAAIPGLGLVDLLLVLNHYRLLGLVLLLPVAASLIQRSSTPRIGSSPVDLMVVGYLALMSILTFRPGNITSALRDVFTLFIDIFLPYYVVSRSIRSEDGFRQAMTGFVMAAMILSLHAVFEVLWSWKLYSGVLSVLGINPWIFGGYLERSGLLRPNASIGNSIALGYVVVVALGFFFYLRQFLSKSSQRLVGTGVLVSGIVASLSRGPWVGAAFLAIVYILISPHTMKRLLQLALGAAVTFGVLNLHSSGQLLIDMLPIVGTAEQGNVEYRANLLTSALPVIERHLMFGSHDFLQAPELQVMMQGEGIIDVVNSYVGVALYSGLFGLLLFVGAFFATLQQLRKSIRAVRMRDARLAILGRALFSTVAAIMLIIYTVSSISAIPVVFWSVLGLCVAFAGLVANLDRKQDEVTAK
ncbi:MAG: O-antigen ligase family protein [Hydrogenophaga sp.]|nr:O-antigen ligase family protein [Hydrogenophaga sp.]